VFRKAILLLSSLTQFQSLDGANLQTNSGLGVRTDYRISSSI
jgi:hypothetical protein